MAKKIIAYHKQWMKDGLPKQGLCFSVPKKYLSTLMLFQPTKEDAHKLMMQNYPHGYWGCDKDWSWLANQDLSDYYRHHSYNERRQTIILFICAMHNEI